MNSTLAETDWESIQETLHILSIPGIRESIIEDSKESIDDCKSLDDIGWNIE